ncbi:hypothetical protein AB3S75_038485 [Citrus x aurantiifolia]
MGIQNQLLLICSIGALAGLLVLATSRSCSADAAAEAEEIQMAINRSNFPPGFIFGAGTSAYAAEGNVDIDGKSPSIWDTFTTNHPEKIHDGSNANVAIDFYHRYKEDIKLMKETGLDSFRFSISWPRLLPKGKISGGVNPLGVQFYNNLIDELIANGIKPFVTLFHWDLPQVLEDKYGGFLSSEIVKDFGDYADFCFKTFGDRVKQWATMAEPNSISIGGYAIGVYAPGRCSSSLGSNCAAGDSATEPYIVSHNLLLSHATAVKLYKEKYQGHQKGEIGITIVTQWFIPKTESPADQEAASRMLDFLFGWFAHPITYGEYPEVMTTLVGSRLPNFSKTESEMLKGSYDFLGINYYAPMYAEDSSSSTSNSDTISYSTDSRVTLSTHKDGNPIGTPTTLPWIFLYPKGIKDFMLYIKSKYNNPAIYITENGVADAKDVEPAQARKDDLRIKCYQEHLWYLLEAIKEGVNVKGYYAWSFLDNFEWDAGFTVGFGMVYVDHKDNLQRYPKDSFFWYKSFLAPPKSPATAFDEL